MLSPIRLGRITPRVLPQPYTTQRRIAYNNAAILLSRTQALRLSRIGAYAPLALPRYVRSVVLGYVLSVLGYY